jgi:hypothetical protein
MQLAEQAASPPPHMLPNWQVRAVESVAGAAEEGRTRRAAAEIARARNCIVKSGILVKALGKKAELRIQADCGLRALEV